MYAIRSYYGEALEFGTDVCETSILPQLGHVIKVLDAGRQLRDLDGRGSHITFVGPELLSYNFV